MLSVLIPVYNFDLTDLVHDLHRAAEQLTEKIEIILTDDGSTEDWKIKNRPLGKLPLVTYEELPKNLGRSAIRNYLAKKAQYDFLLFLDNDQGVVSDSFLKKYIDALPSSGDIPSPLDLLEIEKSRGDGKSPLDRKPFQKVIIGGRCYGAIAPKGIEKYIGLSAKIEKKFLLKFAEEDRMIVFFPVIFACRNQFFKK